MALLNPVHGLVVPFLCAFTIPLAIFAGITSALAFSVLMFRVAVVYIDIALGIIPQYFTRRSKTQMLPEEFHQRRQSVVDFITPISPASSVGSSSDYSTPNGQPSPYRRGNGYNSPVTHRRKSSYGFGAALRHSSRRSSQASLYSHETITPINEDGMAEIEMFVAPSAGLDRDFEGVGGWRLDNQEDDANWTNINSRLELPVETRGSQSRGSRHGHERSQSLGPFALNEAAWLAYKQFSGWNEQSPDHEGRKRASTQSGARSPGRPLLSPGSRILSQLPNAMTSLDPNTGYFPDFVSSRSDKKMTP